MSRRLTAVRACERGDNQGPMGLRLRVIVVLVSPLMLVVGIYGFVRVRQEQEQRLDDNRRNVALVARAVQMAVEIALREGRVGDIRRLLAELVSDEEEVDRIRVFAHDLTPTAVSNSLAIGDDVPVLALQRVIASGRAEPLYEKRHGKLVLYYIVPIRDGRGAPAGALEVVQLAGTVQARLRAAQWEIWFRLALLAVSVAAVAGVMLQRQVLRPLSVLMAGIRRVGRGQAGPPLPVERADEFGRVAVAFNEMAERLEAARRQLLEETERTLDLEQQLRHAETLAVAGKLATAIAHEVGTPLNIISGRAELLLRDLAADDPRRGDLAGIVGQIDRISGIIHSMLDALRPQKPELEIVRVGEIVAHLLPLMEYAARRDGVRLTSDVADSLPSIAADPRQLQQVLINLRERHRGGRPGGRRRSAGRARAPRRSRGGGHQRHRHRAGHPCRAPRRSVPAFFTTKPHGKGTGLGLSICRDIVKEHQGEIAFTAPEGGGTTFVVWLPAPAGASA
jgi:signal transduction histidine kinase